MTTIISPGENINLFRYEDIEKICRYIAPCQLLIDMCRDFETPEDIKIYEDFQDIEIYGKEKLVCGKHYIVMAHYYMLMCESMELSDNMRSLKYVGIIQDMYRREDMTTLIHLLERLSIINTDRTWSQVKPAILILIKYFENFITGIIHFNKEMQINYYKHIIDSKYFIYIRKDAEVIIKTDNIVSFYYKNKLPLLYQPINSDSKSNIES